MGIIFVSLSRISEQNDPQEEAGKSGRGYGLLLTERLRKKEKGGK